MGLTIFGGLCIGVVWWLVDEFSCPQKWDNGDKDDDYGVD